MSEPALNLVADASPVPQELVFQSNNFTERWMWVHATSRYSWWDALRGRPLKIPANDLVHLHGWRRFVCLELKGEPGEEIWVRKPTWDGTPDAPVAQTFSDLAHFTRKLSLDAVMIALSPATVALLVLALLSFSGWFQTLGSNCTNGMKEAFGLYTQIAATLVAVPAATFLHYRWVRESKFLSYQVRRIYRWTAAAVIAVSVLGAAFMAADATSRDTMVKIQLNCLQP